MLPPRSAVAFAFVAFTMVTVVWVSSPDFSSVRRALQIRAVGPTPAKVERTMNAEAGSDSGEQEATVLQSAATSLPNEGNLATNGRVNAEQNIVLGEPFPDESNIFFMETTCWGVDKPAPPIPKKESDLHLSRRAACIIESAAAANPTRTVFLLHTCPLNMSVLLRSTASPQTAALRMPNVRLWLKPTVEIFEGSPLEGWLRTGQLESSKFPREHTSDVLRYLLLWRYGGVYLDTDVMLRRSLPVLRNFASAESTIVVEGAVLAVGLDALGRRLADYLLEEIKERFRGDAWAYNGPYAVTRALSRICGVKEVPKMSEDLCEGFSVLPQQEFFAVPWQKWKRFFDEKEADGVMKTVADSLGVHFWNKLSHGENVSLASRQAYAQLARQHCPRVVAVAGGFL